MAALFLSCAALAQTQPQPLDIAPAAEPQPQPAQQQPGAVQPDPAPAQSPPTAPQPRAKASGLLHALGRFFDRSIGTMTSGWNNARQTVGSIGDRAGDAAKEAADAAREAATSVVRLPTASIVTGREHCLRAANGGPDCAPAIDALCRSKGYSAGASLHIQSEQKCPVWGWIKGEVPAGKCGTETYVTSAMCR